MKIRTKATTIYLHLFVGLSILGISCKNRTTENKEKDKSTGLERPNIVLIMADDMGFSDLGCYGSEIQTPNLDRLAESGMRMTQFYNASRCCPTRASLLTGLYPHQANVGFMSQDCYLPGYGGFLPDNAITLAEALQENGYQTAMTGKWHVGNDESQWPTQRGFERFFGSPRHGGVYFLPFSGNQFFTLGDSIVDLEEDFYSTDAINDYAVDFIEDMAKKEMPFFMYVAHIAPHFPLQAKAEDIAKYRGSYSEGFEVIREKRFEKQKEIGLFPEDYPLSPMDAKTPEWDSLTAAEKDDYDLRMSVYAAQIDAMDQGIGRIVGKLENLGILDNTLIVFLSDNGGTLEDYSRPKMNAPIGEPGSFAGYTLPWANVSNTPYRMYKSWGHEGGIKTPLIMHYPKKINPGSFNADEAHVVDLMPTVIALANGTYPEIYNNQQIVPTEGLSLLPVMEGGSRNGNRPLFWEHEGNRAARVGKWKWINAHPDKVDELYDLSTDPVEQYNLAEAEPRQLKRIKTQWREWADRVGVQPWEKVLEARPEQSRLEINY